MVLSKSTPTLSALSTGPPPAGGSGCRQREQWPSDRPTLEHLQGVIDSLQGQRLGKERAKDQLARLDQFAIARVVAIGDVVAPPGAAQLLALIELARVDLEALARSRVADDDGHAALAAHRGQGLLHDRGP